MGLGGSPPSTARSRARLARGSGIGIAAISACVYGWIGLSYSSRAGESSITLPRYMTAIQSETCRTTERSCAMNTYDRPKSS